MFLGPHKKKMSHQSLIPSGTWDFLIVKFFEVLPTETWDFLDLLAPHPPPFVLIPKLRLESFPRLGVWNFVKQEHEHV